MPAGFALAFWVRASPTSPPASWSPRRRINGQPWSATPCAVPPTPSRRSTRCLTSMSVGWREASRSKSWRRASGPIASSSTTNSPRTASWPTKLARSLDLNRTLQFQQDLVDRMQKAQADRRQPRGPPIPGPRAADQSQGRRPDPGGGTAAARVSPLPDSGSHRLLRLHR